MFDDLIREQDVAWAATLMGLGPDGFAPVGDDDSRFRAMLNLDTVDFEERTRGWRASRRIAA